MKHQIVNMGKKEHIRFPSPLIKQEKVRAMKSEDDDKAEI